jgi:hypothetical protein
VSATAISVVGFACILSGALLGAFLRSSLPQHHLSDESKDTIKVGTGLIATLVALVLGLLVASAKGSFDTKSEELKQGAADVIMLDRDLRRMGPPAEHARLLLRRVIAFRLQVPWGEQAIHALGEPPPAGAASMEDVDDAIRGLSLTNEDARQLQARALQLSANLTQTRWLLIEQTGSTIAMPFIVVVVSWLAVIFASFGLLAPRNVTVWVVILLCALSASAAVFLILELDRPFGGVITLSKEPLQAALNRLDR